MHLGDVIVAESADINILESRNYSLKHFYWWAINFIFILLLSISSSSNSNKNTTTAQIK